MKNSREALRGYCVRPLCCSSMSSTSVSGSRLEKGQSFIPLRWRFFSTGNNRIQEKNISQKTENVYNEPSDGGNDGSNNSSGDDGSQRGGKIFIGLGWTLLGLLVIDQILQYQQKHERERVLKELQEEANARNPILPTWSQNNKYDDENEQSLQPAKYQCKVLRIEPSLLDGTHMLRGIAVGDLVDVLEENVGPSSQYHLCRRRQDRRGWSRQKKSNSEGDGSIGWYPVQFLQKVE